MYYKNKIKRVMRISTTIINNNEKLILLLTNTKTHSDLS